MVDLFADAEASGFVDFVHDRHQTLDKGHGRLERRQYWTIADAECISYLHAKEAWPGLRSIGMGDRRAPGWGAGVYRTSLLHHESRAGMLKPLEKPYAAIGVSKMASHSVLDIAFQEDMSRMRKDYSQQNFVVLRHMALNLLKQEHTAKCGIKARRRKRWLE